MALKFSIINWFDMPASKSSSGAPGAIAVNRVPNRRTLNVYVHAPRIPGQRKPADGCISGDRPETKPSKPEHLIELPGAGNAPLAPRRYLGSWSGSNRRYKCQKVLPCAEVGRSGAPTRSRDQPRMRATLSGRSAETRLRGHKRWEANRSSPCPAPSMGCNGGSCVPLTNCAAPELVERFVLRSGPWNKP